MAIGDQAVHCLGNKYKWQHAAQNIISRGHCSTAVHLCTETKRHVQTSGSTGDGADKATVL